MNKIFFFLVVFLFIHCEAEKDSTSFYYTWEEVQSLEGESLDKAITATRNLLEDPTLSETQYARLKISLGKLYIHSGREEEGRELIFEGLREYPSNKIPREEYLETYEVLDTDVEHTESQKFMALGFEELYPREDQPSFDSIIRTSEFSSLNEWEAYYLNKLANDTTGISLREDSKVYLELADVYIATQPRDSMTAEVAFRSAQAAHSLRRFNKADNLFGWVYENFPDHSKGKIALFMRGFLADENFNNDSLARQYYSRFVSEYPGHPLAKDAKHLMEN